MGKKHYYSTERQAEYMRSLVEKQGFKCNIINHGFGIIYWANGSTLDLTTL